MSNIYAHFKAGNGRGKGAYMLPDYKHFIVP